MTLKAKGFYGVVVWAPVLVLPEALPELVPEPLPEPLPAPPVEPLTPPDAPVEPPPVVQPPLVLAPPERVLSLSFFILPLWALSVSGASPDVSLALAPALTEPEAAEPAPVAAWPLAPAPSEPCGFCTPAAAPARVDGEAADGELDELDEDELFCAMAAGAIISAAAATPVVRVMNFIT